MRSKIIRLFIFGLFVFILSGCGPSEEETLATIETMIDSTFDNQRSQPNHEFASFDIYLPDHISVIEETESNLIFTDQEQTYILFYNTLEEQDSRFFYQSAKATENYALLEAYEDDNRFGYVKVAEVEDNYELQVGVGGVRLTTHTSLDEMDQDLIKMVTMVNSIDFHQ